MNYRVVEEKGCLVIGKEVIVILIFTQVVTFFHIYVSRCIRT